MAENLLLSPPRQQWSSERIVSAIRSRYYGGHPINAQTLEEQDPKLLAAGRRYFGTWSNAVEAAGVPCAGARSGNSRHGRGYWTRELIIEQIREEARLGHPLHAHAVQRRANRLVSAATYHFGSWAEALRHAGYDAENIRAVHRHSRESIVSEILQLMVLGEDLRDCKARQNHRRLYWAAQKYFGSWRSAVVAAAEVPSSP